MSLDLACSLNVGIPQKFSQTLLSFPYGFSTLAPSHITQTPIIPSTGTTSESAFPAQAPCIHDKVCAGLRSWSKEHGWGIKALDEGLANLFCEVPESFCPSYSTLSLQHRSSHGQHLTEQAWLCSGRAFFSKTRGRQDLVISCWSLLFTDFQARSPFRVHSERKKGMRGREKLSPLLSVARVRRGLTFIHFAYIVEQDLICTKGFIVRKFESRLSTCGASLVAQLVKNLPAGWETWVGEDPLEEGIATHSSILAWRIPWAEEPARLQSSGLQRVRYDWSDLARTHLHVLSGSFSGSICHLAHSGHCLLWSIFFAK